MSQDNRTSPLTNGPPVMLAAREVPQPPLSVAALKDEASSREILSNALKHLRGDEKMLRNVAKVFLESSPDFMSQVQQALASADSKALAVAAHTLKGAVGNFGIHEAYEAIMKLEAAGADDIRTARQAWREVQRHMEALTRSLQAYLGEIPCAS